MIVKPPTVAGEYPIMPEEIAARKEAAIGLLGQHLFSLRNQRLDTLRSSIETEGARDRLGAVQRKEIEAVAALGLEARQAALGLARKAIDLYMQDILVLFAGTGSSLAFGPNHAITYQLNLEVRDFGSGDVVEKFVTNRGGEKVFYEHYGRWLIRHGDHR